MAQSKSRGIERFVRLLKHWRRCRWWLWLLLVALTLWLSSVGTQLYRHAHAPPDGILVLGGSIRRELAIAKMMAQGSPVPVLISQGSKPPCIRTLFERAEAPLTNVWLETCAQSTFDNFRYSLPSLKQWQVSHVIVVTSPTHVPRAAWLGKIMLGSHGIWVEMELVEEIGTPGNAENLIKTVLDVGRSLGWALVSYVYQPRCPALMSLESVDLAAWSQRGYRCEHQADIEPIRPE
ncbi:MAG: YdcF family protein [Leptolyngbyaceae cyanobacterium]